MSELLYMVIEAVARIHDKIMTMNDSFEYMFTDKELHFIIMGILGMAILLVIFPLFKLLSKHHVLVIAWIYVFTVMTVVTFAIEIGQGFTGTGSMDMDDVVAGMAGFMVMFIIFAAIRGIFLMIVHLIKELMDKDDDDDE